MITLISPPLKVINAAGAITNQAAITQWEKDDNLATHYIYDSCCEEQQHTLLTCETAHAMWLSLTNKYQQNTVERRQNLQQELLNYQYLPENNVRAHVEAIKLLTLEFKKAGGTFDDEAVCNKIITSLPPSYDHFLTSWESCPVAARTLDDLITRLDREEIRVNRKYGTERSPQDKAYFSLQSAFLQLKGTRAPPQIALSACNNKSFTTLPYRDTSQRNPPPGSSRGRCPWCRIIGHEEKDCEHKKNGTIACTHCGICGHEEKNCNRRKREQSRNSSRRSRSPEERNQNIYRGYTAKRRSRSRSRSPSGRKSIAY